MANEKFPKQGLEIKEKLEYLKFLSQTHRSVFDERRRYEWKIFFTVLSLYVLTVAAVYGGTITISKVLFIVLIWLIFIFLAVITAIFLGFIHMANSKNKIAAEKSENYIALIIEDKDPTKILTNTDKTKPSLFSFDDNNISWTKWNNLFKPDKSEKILSERLFEGGRWAWFLQSLILIFAAIASAIMLTVK